MYIFGRQGNVGAPLIHDQQRLDGSYIDEPSHLPACYISPFNVALARPSTITNLFKLEIIKTKPIGEGLNNFRDLFNLTY